MAKNKSGGDAPKASIIIIRKNKGHGHGHHGGSWKVALADFMTAMMAFFLLMWLLEAASPKEMLAIAGYFQEPGSNRYMVGPGGADSAVIQLQAPMENEPLVDAGESTPLDAGGIIGDTNNPVAEETEKELEEIPSEVEESASAEALLEQLAQFEQGQLEELQDQLTEEINNADSVLNLLKEQIRMEFTELGLSIQIVDKERRSMFNEGSARLQIYSEDALFALAPIVNKVPNKISIVGHTDAKPYTSKAYSNWELSSDRANSARRALIEGGYPEDKVIAVQGMASVAPMLPQSPMDPSNRRIAIVVLKQEVAEAMMKIDPAAGKDLIPNTLPPAARSAPSRVMSESEIDRAIEAAK